MRPLTCFNFCLGKRYSVISSNCRRFLVRKLFIFPELTKKLMWWSTFRTFTGIKFHFPSLILLLVLFTKAQKNELNSQLKAHLETWTKRCRQIHKIKQNRFLKEMFCWWFLAVFYHKYQSLHAGSPAGYAPSNPSISGIFLKFPNFLRS